MFLSFFFFSFLSLVCAQNLTDIQLALVSARLDEAAKQSWELGTRSQAILELNATQYSVFSPSRLPPPSSVPSSLADPLQPFFSIARSVVSNRGASNANITGPQPLIKDGSAADPASIGISVLLANWTGLSQADNLDYGGAAKDQLDYLLNSVPRSSDGAISHRVASPQLWSDFIYMVPPFLAYYGVMTRNMTLLMESYNQIKIYRSNLRDSSSGLWKHVINVANANGSAAAQAPGEPQEDLGFWSTGNAWAAAGMLRTLNTIANSEYANSMKSQQKDLLAWIREVHDGMYNILNTNSPSTGIMLFANYPDKPATDTGNFYDAASTAMLAASVFRLAVARQVYTHIPLAEKCRQALFTFGDQVLADALTTSSAAPTSTSSVSQNVSSTSLVSSTKASSIFTSTLTTPIPTQSSTSTHLSEDGWLTPVVNPHAYGVIGEKSAEAQAFVLDLHSAWRDWNADGAKGANGARRLLSGTGNVFVPLVVVLAVALIGI